MCRSHSRRRSSRSWNEHSLGDPPWTSSLAQPIGIELGQFAWHEQPILADELSVEADFAAAVVGALDADHVPVNLALVAIVGFLVGLSGGEVEAAGDFFVE